jgi:release factor glutamine methyltransferase
MPAVAGSVGDALSAATDALRAAGVENPRLDAELLLAEATGADRARLAADPGAEVAAAAGRSYGAMVRRRLRREPVAYILGRRGFRRIELEVDRRVLIPRPETELLVELAIELEPESVLDIGTGSGAIALAVAEELPGCRVTGTDTSAAALEVAGANARRLGLTDRVRLLPGSVPAGEEFDLVLCNPPYIAEPDWSSLQPEITEWEPREALLAGSDGLDAYRALLPRVRVLSPYSGQNANSAGAPGVIGLEVGDGQAEAVAGLLGDAGFAATDARRDLAGIERLVVGRTVSV